jgi:magnesium-transporting ATPase (P-type)
MNNPAPVSGDKTSEKLWYQHTVEESLAGLQSGPAGLTPEEAKNKLQHYGPNVLPQKEGKSLFIKFISHFKDILIYILLAAGVVTAIMGHWVDTLVILAVAVINALIGFIQENNAEKSLKSIQNMLSSEAVVLRGGQQVTVGTDEIVPGDIVLLRPGDKIPADLRLIDVHNLRVEEAILTGESTVVSKKPIRWKARNPSATAKTSRSRERPSAPVLPAAWCLPPVARRNSATSMKCFPRLKTIKRRCWCR